MPKLGHGEGNIQRITVGRVGGLAKCWGLPDDVY